MKKHARMIYTAIILGILLSIPIVNVWFRATEQSLKRIEREHGLILPQSARNFQCRGDAWRGFLDRGASSIFIMNRTDYEYFISQFHLIQDPTYHTFIPGNAIYQHAVTPWNDQALPEKTYSCLSSVGDWLHVAIYALNTREVGVWLYTDWN